MKDLFFVKDFGAMRAKILHETKYLRDHVAGRTLACPANQAYGTVAAR
jgi:hypothetical protein